jgi:hypothetical protein
MKRWLPPGFACPHGQNRQSTSHFVLRSPGLTNVAMARRRRTTSTRTSATPVQALPIDALLELSTCPISVDLLEFLSCTSSTLDRLKIFRVWCGDSERRCSTARGGCQQPRVAVDDHNGFLSASGTMDEGSQTGWPTQIRRPSVGGGQQAARDLPILPPLSVTAMVAFSSGEELR